MLKLNVVTVSTRPGRAGLPLAAWAARFAREHGAFEVVPVDLADFDLPVYDEPRHPRFRKYEHAHTKRWSESVDAADAFVFVTPEYDYGPAPALLNALVYLSQEWRYKPAAFVSYGGISGGLRAAQATKLTLTALNVMPITEGVVVPFFTKSIEEGVFKPNDIQVQAATLMLDELKLWAGALKPLRQK